MAWLIALIRSILFYIAFYGGSVFIVIASALATVKGEPGSPGTAEADSRAARQARPSSASAIWLPVTGGRPIL